MKLKDLEGNRCGLIDVLSLHLCGETEEKYKNPQSSVLAQIQTEHLLIYVVDHYCTPICLMAEVVEGLCRLQTVQCSDDENSEKHD